MRNLPGISQSQNWLKHILPASVNDDPPHLTEQSLICGACYIHFKAMLKHIQLEKETTSTSVKQEPEVERNADIITKLFLFCHQKWHTYLQEIATMSNYLTVCCMQGLQETLEVHESSVVLVN